MLIQDQEKIKSIMDELSKLEIKSFNYLNNDGDNVPRVTEVLSAMLHDDFLMNWANGLGWKRIGYRAFLKAAAEKGTYSHLAIEKFLKTGIIPKLEELNIPNNEYFNTVKSTFTAFHKWWEFISSQHKEIKLVYSEEKLICKYFGGTCDCVLKVDDEYWLIDFKTSSHMNYKYSLQLSAYKYLLKELKGIDISKAITLLLDKESGEYSTYELFVSNPFHNKFMEDCLQTFMMLTSAYRMRLETNKQHDIIFQSQYSSR